MLRAHVDPRIERANLRGAGRIRSFTAGTGGKKALAEPHGTLAFIGPYPARFKTLMGPELRLKDRRQWSCEHNAQRECHAGLVPVQRTEHLHRLRPHADRESSPQLAPAEAPS